VKRCLNNPFTTSLGSGETFVIPSCDGISFGHPVPRGNAMAMGPTIL